MDFPHQSIIVLQCATIPTPGRTAVVTACCGRGMRDASAPYFARHRVGGLAASDGRRPPQLFSVSCLAARATVFQIEIATLAANLPRDAACRCIACSQDGDGLRAAASSQRARDLEARSSGCFAAACLGLTARCASHSCSQLDMLEIWIVLDGFGLSGVGLDWIGY